MCDQSTSRLSQNPMFVGRNFSPRTPTSAAPNRINGDYSAANDVSPAMLLTSDELRQFEVNLRLVHGTYRSYAAPEGVHSTGSSDRIGLRRTSETVLVPQEHTSSESIMEQRRRTFTGPIRNLQGAFDQSSAANTVALRPMSSSASRNVQRVNAYSEGTNVAHGEWAMPGVTHAYAAVGRGRPYCCVAVV
jgi:hypothetical protein